MIELVVAIALAIAMISAVYAATRSMADSARRQQSSSAREAHWDAVVEIIRRDLRGWMLTKSGSTKTANLPSNETILFQLSTTADSVASGTVDGTGTARQRATLGVQYKVRKALDKFELVRVEANSSQDAELILLSSDSPPTLEVFNGTDWLQKTPGNNRPAAVRLLSGAPTIVVKL